MLQVRVANVVNCDIHRVLLNDTDVSIWDVETLP
jgi:hypothetical protein